jgi:short-subunit dehydrogenase
VRRSVLVTGANSGIGHETVLHLARLGFHAVGTARSEDKAEALAKAARDEGLDVDSRVLDVTDADGCERVTSGLELYGLVNNAG